MDEFDIVLESYETVSEIYKTDMQSSIVCEALCLPAEEGAIDAAKKTIKVIYDGFKRLVKAFKNWVCSIISRIKSFFKKDKKNDTDPSPSPSTKAPQTDAKEDVSKLQNIVKQADAVENNLKKASSGNTTPEEVKDLNKQADDAASAMKEIKKAMEIKYPMLPSKSESGNVKETETDQSLKDRHEDYINSIKLAERIKEEKKKYPNDASDSDEEAKSKFVNELASRNPFKFKNFDKWKSDTKSFISICAQIENKNKKIFYSLGTRGVPDLIKCFRYVIFDVRDPNYKEAAHLMLSYMQSRIPSAIQKHMNKQKSDLAECKKNLRTAQSSGDTQTLVTLYYQIFYDEPNKNNLDKLISAIDKFLGY